MIIAESQSELELVKEIQKVLSDLGTESSFSLLKFLLFSNATLNYCHLYLNAKTNGSLA